MSLNIALIGSGFAQAHLNALAQCPEANISAICSRNQETGEKLATANKASYYAFDDYKTMLDEQELDAVYICLPPFLHGQLEIDCAAKVKGLFLEKPVALDMETARRMQEAFTENGNIVSVGYMNRYRKNLELAREHFTEEAPVLINAAWSGALPPPYWWRRKEMSGGQLTEQCTHFIDAIRYIAGEIEEVQAMETHAFIDDVEDLNVANAMTVNIKLKNGAIGAVQTSCFSKAHGGGEMGLYCELSSREKTFRFSEHQMNLEIQHSRHQTETHLSAEDAVLLENQAFLAALQGKENHILSSFEDAVESLKVGLAADLSIKEKRTVKISEI